MNIHQTTKGIEPSLIMGGKILMELQGYALKAFPKDFQIVRATRGSLCLSYHGYHILFRVELMLTESTIFSKLCAYSITYDKPRTAVLRETWVFDQDGTNIVAEKHMPSSLRLENCAETMFAQVFNKCLEEGMVLKPGYEVEQEACQ